MNVHRRVHLLGKTKDPRLYLPLYKVDIEYRPLRCDTTTKKLLSRVEDDLRLYLFKYISPRATLSTDPSRVIVDKTTN